MILIGAQKDTGGLALLRAASQAPSHIHPALDAQQDRT